MTEQITSRLWAVLGTALCAVAAPSWAADSTSPAAYALRLPVTLAADAPVQRLELPAKALLALQTAGYADVRVFNASGQAVPMALGPTPRAEAARQQTPLTAYPLLGRVDAAPGTLDGMALRIEERSRNGVPERVVTVNAPAAASGVASQHTLGALLDARMLQRPAVGLVLHADLPTGQPITFSVATSADLATWQPLASTVLFQADGDARLGASTLTWAPARLQGRYLRVTWTDAAGQRAGVTLRTATVITTGDGSEPVRPSATVATPVVTSPRTVSFSLPFAAPVAALQIRPEGNNVVIPLRVLGRPDASQPWQALASTVAYRLTAAGAVQTNAPVALPGTAVRDFELQVDEKTAGFAMPPHITALFNPVQLVFVASGPAPFTLAVGLPQAAPAWLAFSTLVPSPSTGIADPALQAAALPLAAVAADDAGPAVIAGLPANDRPPLRSAVLWAVLVAGVLALALMAWRLLKHSPSPAPGDPDAA